MSDQGYRPAAWQVKRMLTEERIPANSAMARFVGIEDYEAAGGPVLRDLFAAEDESGVWLEDPVLLQKLAMKKLGETVTELQTRWRWARPRRRWTGPRSPATGASLPSLPRRLPRRPPSWSVCAPARTSSSDLDEEDWTEELDEEAEAIETRTCEINAAVEARAAYRTEDCALAGCIATIDWRGELQIVAGLVRPEDMPKPADSGDSAGGEAA